MKKILTTVLINFLGAAPLCLLAIAPLSSLASAQNVALVVKPSREPRRVTKFNEICNRPDAQAQCISYFAEEYLPVQLEAVRLEAQ